MSKYLYELIPYEGNKIKDTIEAEDLMQAFNIIDGEYGLASGLFKDINIELLRRNI